MRGEGDGRNGEKGMERRKAEGQESKGGGRREKDSPSYSPPPKKK